MLNDAKFFGGEDCHGIHVGRIEAQYLIGVLNGTDWVIQSKKDSGAHGNGVDIFGSSGGSKGTTKSRGVNGDSSGDTVTTGSATVKILRPPSEAGGAPPKLEKTPSLTNDTVIELIEAGFSEGTIVRRIEQSPVAFDFSPEKLAELRRHRVSEKIMTAMKASMGINASPDNTPSRTSNVTPKQ